MSKLGYGLVRLASSLKGKFLLTMLVVMIYRIGTYVPLPFVDAAAYADVLSPSGSTGSSFFAMANAISGGAIGRYSVFSLNVMPYIVASIITQLLFAAFFRDKKGESSGGTVDRYTRYLTLVFAIAQGTVLSLGMLKGGSMLHVYGLNKFADHLLVVLSLVTGSMFLVWLGGLITSYGVGNGISVIIFAGIAGEIPSSIYSTLELGRVGVYSNLFVVMTLCFLVLLIAFVVFIEKSSRNIAVHYPKRQIGGKLYAQHTSYIPIKINMSGVIPAIFANTVLLIPFSFSGYGVSESISGIFRMGSGLYYLFYCTLILFFSFFYTAVVFNPLDVADNLKKAGGLVGGLRPGPSTAAYIQKVADRLTCLGAVYMSFVCIVVDAVRMYYSIPFALGGTSVLIMVGVVNDVINQIRLHALGCRYDDAIKKSGFRHRRCT